MEFKKTAITRKDLKDLARKLWNKYREVNTDSVILDMEIALEAVVFEVEEEFDPDGWNNCTIRPPKEYDGADVIIRERAITKYEEGFTRSLLKNRLAFIDLDHDTPFRNESVINEDLTEYEYKLIK